MTVSVPEQPGQLEILAGLIAARVQGIQDTPDPWMGRAEVMEHTRYSTNQISVAFAGGDGKVIPGLHCHRIGDRGRPRTKRSVVDAWLSGASPDQQRQVCGCTALHRWRPG